MHTRNTLAALIAGLAITGMAQAQSASYENTAPREQRMEQALQNYRSSAPSQAHGPAQRGDHMRSGDPRNPQPGPAARGQERMKQGAKRTGQAIKRGAERTGEAASDAAQRTGAAIRRGTDRLTN